MTLEEFVANWSGRRADFPGGDGGQCVDLVEFWAQNLGFPRFFGNAIDQAGHAWPGATWTPNCGPCVPKPGDVVVWGSAVGVFGHIAIFMSGDANSFTSFDQNWPIGSLCHLQGHNYNGVLGWQATSYVQAAPPPQPQPPPEPRQFPPGPPAAAGPGIGPSLLLLAAGLGAIAYAEHRRPGTLARLARHLEREAAELGERAAAALARVR